MSSGLTLGFHSVDLSFLFFDNREVVQVSANAQPLGPLNVELCV